MKRRFNYTERKRITLDRVAINVVRRKGLPESFSASIRLQAMNLPEAAKIYIEAYHRTDSTRYYLGTVGKPEVPENTRLTGLTRQEDLKFRVLVVDEAGERGLILASADRIRPSTQYEKRSILPVEISDLGRQVWRLDFNGDQPVLVLNERLPNVLNLPTSDPRFRLYILPAVLREVFCHMFFVERVEDLEEPAEEWHMKWLDFARTVLPYGTKWPEKTDEQFSADEINDWIDLLEQEFCASLGKDWMRLASLEEEG